MRKAKTLRELMVMIIQHGIANDSNLDQPFRFEIYRGDEHYGREVELFSDICEFVQRTEKDKNSYDGVKESSTYAVLKIR